ncbi:MAG TPA: hypothetical protein DCW90_09700 [Lachnospiraceae bacterium]|nr:hypothetical protein [Lachnospiraceae bacterium]
MIFYVECSLNNFDAWCGGERVLNELRDHEDAFDYIENLLEEMVSETWSNTDVNDYLWFTALDDCEEAGYYNGETGLWYDDEGFEEEEDE